MGMKKVRMLLTEHDAVMAKWCPMIRRRWEARPFAYKRSNSAPQPALETFWIG
jgi:hypothetical protein